MVGDTAYNLAFARAPVGLGWLGWICLHAAQGHGWCIKCIMKSNMDMHPEEEIKTGSGDVLALLAHRIPATQPQQHGQSERDMDGLYDGIY